MDLDVVLSQAKAAMLEEAYTALEHSHASHYEAEGEAVTRERLAGLLDLVLASIRDRDLAEIGAYAERVAAQRFEGGFDLFEVQTAFNSLEVAMWRQVVSTVSPQDLVEAIGLLSTVLGFGKDALARKYVSLASRRHVRSLDLSALFAGTNS